MTYLKKLVTIVSIPILILISLPTQAQLDLGIKVGINFANIETELSDYENFTSYHIGVFANLDVSDILSFQPGALYSIKGAKVLVGGEDATYNLQYLEIPINLSSSFGRVNIFAGPYFGIGLEGNLIFTNDREKVQFVYDEKDLSSEVIHGFSMVDVGLNFGAAYKLKETVMIQGTYGLGLTNMMPKIDGEDPEIKLTNKVLQLSLVLFL